MTATSPRPNSATRLSIRLTPRAGRDEVVRLDGDVLFVRVAAPPVEGAANEALVTLLAKRLSLPRSSVTVAHGHGSRNKVVEIEGLDRVALLARLLPGAQ